MSQARFLVGDVFDVLASLEPASVDLVMTSPPFLALRSYLPADHPQKAREIGSEATPGEFIDRMLDVVEACARVLAPHGSLVFELGDTYAGSGGGGGDYNEGGLRDGAPGFDGSAARFRAVEAEAYRAMTQSRRRDKVPVPRASRIACAGWPMEKSKVLIPQLFAVALAYGFNPLTGRQTEPWRVRNTVAWARPNPPVGRDGDKFRPATSFLTVACKARDRYWDGDAVRTEPQGDRRQAGYEANGASGAFHDHGNDGIGRQQGPKPASGGVSNPAGAPLLDWWEIPTAPYKGSHYATYPPDLVVPVVKAMCPPKVCRACGLPSRRITETSYVRTRDGGAPNLSNGHHGPDDLVNKKRAGIGDNGASAVVETLGWSDCGHNDWRAGVVLDPFAGSGTSLAVATGHGLDAIGIDLDERNAELAYERIGGLFLSIEHPVKPLGAHALGECSTSGIPNP